ncbi:Putative 2-aminoethylphosphonate import ATP-binding protein PhnT [Pseudidiomarina piscicola]|uniref:2-aminoethylphosphonate import ATP-binding protein PhnT n=1 Tax=Pseudidiomarina piscicola TaxID=2614830 RepID=A0A6S6WQA2_9GAMM|nr:molybdenum ABC transporter ATP-binding protein [Pseudidiomarina piscicola]CAB0151496.1 Putative 2-aminoethylphosphonate import ATP-binding protein PhnT [Pseudidiomarina piscicola]VZT40975.1 Putative 2-aminoethylphosphonate import ATP-binding protein PhnT [Pseudomonas aeruginosa]
MSLTVKCQLPLRHFVLAVDVRLPAQGITAIVGPSGSGKTSLLEVIAGIRQLPGATIQFQDQCWQAPATFSPLHQRRIGLVFQQPSLFPHLTVEENLRYGWQRASQPKTLGWDEVIADCGLTPMLGQYPAQLSGGQQQRVAFARALLAQPQLLILDEPFSALDDDAREYFVSYLQQLAQRHQLPMIWVSHQLGDVAQVSDYLVQLHDGHVVAHGPTVSALQSEPLRSKLALSVVVAEAQPEPAGQLDTLRLTLAEQSITLPRPQSHELETSTPVRLRIFARDVSLTREFVSDSSIQNQLAAEVVDSFPARHPAECIVQLRLGDQYLLALITKASWQRLGLQTGSRVIAHLKAAALHETLRETL